MKILMISANVATSPYPVYPIGCSMVAAALAAAGHEVRQFDFLRHEQSLETLAAEVSRFAPDLAGVSVRNVDNVNFLNERRYVSGVRDIVGAVRGVSGVKVVLGGPGFSLIPGPILEATGADYGVVGEGEALMADFAAGAARGVYPGARILGPEMRLQRGDIPSARYDPDILGFYLTSGNMAPVQTKRGCPHSCVYCSYPVLEGKGIRSRDPAAVVDDVVRLRDEHGVKYVFFVDSVFNDDEGSHLEVVGEMERRGVSIPWTGFFKPTGLTDESLERMKGTGLAAVEIGADAACDATLRGMGKSFLYGDILAASEMLARHDIASAHFYMFGGPGESRETVLEGIENIRRLEKCVVFAYLGVRVLPRTPLAALAVRDGIAPRDDDLLDPVYYFSPVLDRKWTEETLARELGGMKHCVFPPDAMDDKLAILHRLRYTGPMWDLILAARKKRSRAPRSPG